MLCDDQAARDAVAEVGFFESSRGPIDQNRGHAAVREHAGGLAERLKVAIVQSDIERAGSPVRHGDPALCAGACDKVVVQVEAADAKVEQRVALARFDVRSQDACRRLRSAHADTAIVDDVHRRASPGELVGHCAADDAGSDHDDVGGAYGHGPKAYRKGFSRKEAARPLQFPGILATLVNASKGRCEFVQAADSADDSQQFTRLTHQSSHNIGLMPRRPVLKPDARRRQLLAAAATVFATTGYRAAGITDIVQTAGVARGTFYLYFEGKANVFLAIADDFYDRLEQAVEAPGPEPDFPTDGRAAIRATFRRYLEFFHLNRHAAVAMLREAPAIDARFNRGIAELRQTTLSHFMRRVRSLQERRLVQSTLPNDVGAHLLVGMFEEVVQAYVLDAEEPDLEALADVMADVAWRGMGRGPV